jgi:Cu(I)/Ag(I) efflux system membrane fusion protein
MKKLIKYIQMNYGVVLGLLAAGILLGWLLFHPSRSDAGNHPRESEEVHVHSDGEAAVWTCSMHPQIRQDSPGKCPICGMDLVPLQTLAGAGDETGPDAVKLSPAALKLAQVETETVSSGQPVGTFYLQGKIEPDERKDAELTARFGGRIEELYINFTGQQVELGEPLATIYSPELVAAQRELLEAARFRETRPALYEAARTRLELWELTDEQIASIVEEGNPEHHMEIRSPIRGTIMKRHVATGDYVKEGSPLFRVTDLSNVWVMLDAYESDLPWIRKGDRVEITVPAVPGRTLTGRVEFIDPFIDPETRVAKARIALANPGDLLKPEMLVNGVLYSRMAGNTETLMIPASAVLWTGKRSVVYVKHPGPESSSFTYREVVLGPRAGEHYIVEAGLQEGEEIAVNGVFKIDAAAQLEGKPSMMNPGGNTAPPEHEHGTMNPGMEMSGSQGMNDPGGPSGNQQLHTSFRVGGNCGMCKDRIEEAALSVAGVRMAEWEAGTGILQLDYNGEVPLGSIHHAIASVGHDTELEQAPDSVYAELPECCLYERFTYE